MDTVIAPSVKYLQKCLKIDIDTAKQVRRILKAAANNPPKCGNPDCVDYACYDSFTGRKFSAMIEVSSLLGFYGVEGLSVKTGYHDYINTGETYTCTIIRKHGTNRFFLCDIGTIIEREG
jgi:hypothetical protein